MFSVVNAVLLRPGVAGTDVASYAAATVVLVGVAIAARYLLVHASCASNQRAPGE